MSSSTDYSSECEAKTGRLHYPGDGWRPLESDDNPWLGVSSSVTSR